MRPTPAASLDTGMYDEEDVYRQAFEVDFGRMAVKLDLGRLHKTLRDQQAAGEVSQRVRLWRLCCCMSREA